jgi:long-chain acyl-CoA synthetase
VLAPGRSLDEEALRDFVRPSLAAYKVPRRILAVDDLPRSLIGKVIRRQVRDRLLAE